MLKFSKMHGLGNDFILIDAINQEIDLNGQQIRLLADRHRGIGCDQLLLVEASKRENVDFCYRIFNADGGEVAQCGNGARCFARFVRDRQLTDKDRITVETASGIIYLILKPEGDVTVDMGLPRFEPVDIPFISNQRADRYTVILPDEQTIDIGVVSMGNPHAVVVVDDIATTNVEVLGALLENHPQFPQRVNVGFMQIINSRQIKLRVYERGAGETQACGTGACAAAVIGIQRGILEQEVTVSLLGGDLNIVWRAGHDDTVWMTGSATHVFDGEIAWSRINQQ